jgi:hypothetical protein
MIHARQGKKWSFPFRAPARCQSENYAGALRICAPASLALCGFDFSTRNGPGGGTTSIASEIVSCDSR